MGVLSKDKFHFYASQISTAAEQENISALKNYLTIVRENLVEVFTDPDFFHNFFPAFFKVLTRIKPSLIKNDVHMCRKIVLKIIQKIPFESTLEPFVYPLIEICMKILRTDNEENASVVIKIIMDIHKKYMKTKKDLAKHVQPFLDFVKVLYKNFRAILDDLFSNKERQKGYLPQSLVSCRVLTECPLLVVFLFQAYQNTAEKNNLHDLLTLMIGTFKEIPKIPPITNTKMRINYGALVSCRVKTASFLAYTLRVYHNYIQSHRETIPKIVTDLLLKCPNECVQARKELLVIMRHMIDSKNSNLRDYFVPYIEKFLVDENLVGKNKIAHESMRPLAYSTLADLIHHVRNKLSLSLIKRTVTFYTRVMYDHTMKLAIQTMSAKLLVHLVESIFVSKEKEQGRNILLCIMEAFIVKIKTLSTVILKILKDGKLRDYSTINIPFDPIHGSKLYNNKNVQTLRNQCRTMVKTLVLGLKNVVYVIHNLERTTKEVFVPFQRTRMFISLFRNGVNCFQIYDLTNLDNVPIEAKENLDAFASLFTVLSSQSFREITEQLFPFLYEKMLTQRGFLQITRHFLASVKLSKIFASILCDFLNKKFQKLEGNSNEGSVLIRLYKLLFASIVSHPMNEPVIMKNLGKFITSCVKQSNRSIECLNYLNLLRVIFRSLLSGKFLVLCNSILPHIHMLMQKLNSLIRGCPKSPFRDLLVELYLTIPAKLHVLCPYIPQLIKPIMYALEGHLELVAFGLRNFELWLTSFGTKPVVELIKPRLSNVLMTIFTHLKPKPYKYGLLALKILSKLGGYSRQFPLNPANVTSVEMPFNLSLKVKFNEDVDDENKMDIEKNCWIRVDSYVKQARRMIFTQSISRKTKGNAILFLQNVSYAFLGATGNTKDFKIPSELIEKDVPTPSFSIFERNCENCSYNVDRSASNKSEMLVQSEESLFRLILTSLFETATLEGFEDICHSYITDITRHFALLLISHNNKTHIHGKDLHRDIFLDAITSALMYDHQTGTNLITKFFDNILTVCQDKEVVSSLGFWESLIVRFCHCCYQRDWKKSLGGCRGIQCLIDFLPGNWLVNHETRIVQALLFGINESPEVVNTELVKITKVTIKSLVKSCQNDYLKRGNKISAFGEVGDDGKPIIKEGKDLYNLFEVLISEISSGNAHVRNTVIFLIKYICELSDQEEGCFLAPFLSLLNKNLHLGRFRQNDMSLKRGFVEALTYFVSVRPKFIPFDDIRLDIFNRALFIVKNMTSEEKKGMTYEEKKSLHTLEISALKLLGAVLNCKVTEEEIKVKMLQKKIVEQFFKHIAHNDEFVVMVCKQSLEEYMKEYDESGYVKKDVLKGALKEHLGKLSKVTNLTAQTISTMHHLLELCTTYFSAKLFSNLQKHLEKWKDPHALKQFDNDEAKVKAGAQLLGLFCLLPNKQEFGNDAAKVVQVVYLLENTYSHFCTESYSPFRLPLAKYLNKYPQHCFNFFFHKNSEGKNKVFVDDKYYNMFITMIKLGEECSKVSILLTKDQGLNTLLGLLTEKIGDQNELELELRVIELIREVSKIYPTFLMDNEKMMRSLTSVWRKYMHNTRHMTFASESIHIRKIKLLLGCYIQCYNQKLDSKIDMDILYEMLIAFSDKAAVDYAFLKDFYDEQLPRYSKNHILLIFTKLISYFELGKMTSPFFDDMITEAFLHLIIPIINYSEEKDLLGSNFDQEFFDVVIPQLLRYGRKFHLYSNGLHVELIKMLTSFVIKIPDKMKKYDEQILDYCEFFFTNKLITFKQCIYALAAYTIKNFGAKGRVIELVYRGMLSEDSQEGKEVVQNAVNACINKIVASPHMQELICNKPRWIYITQQASIDVFSTSELNHLWMIILKHKELFFPFKNIFILNMVTSLTRIGTSTNLSFENRKLALEITKLILDWQRIGLEKKYKEFKKEKGVSEEEMKKEAPPKVSLPQKRKREMSDKEKERYSKRIKITLKEEMYVKNREKFITKEDGIISKQICEFVIAVVRVVNGRPPTSKGLLHQAKELSNLCVKIFYQTMFQISDGELAFVKILGLFGPNGNEDLVLTGMKILCIVNEFRKDVIVKHMDQIIIIASSCFRAINKDILAYLMKFLSKMLVHFPIKGELPKAVKKFYNTLWDSIKVGFERWDRSHKYRSHKFNLTGYLKVLSALCEAVPEEAHTFTGIVHNILQKLLKNVFQQVTGELKRKEMQKQNQYEKMRNRTQLSSYRKVLLSKITSQVAAGGIDAILLCVRFLSRPNFFKKVDEFYSYLLTIGHVIEKTDFYGVRMSGAFLGSLSKFFFNSKNNTNCKYELSLKQKAYFISKLSRLEHKGMAQLRDKYFGLMYRLYIDKKLMSEKNFLPNKIESLFLCAIENSEGEPKRRFLKTLKRSLKRDLFERLVFISQSEHWEHLKSHFWIKIANDLLLDVVDVGMPVDIGTFAKFKSIIHSEDNEREDHKVKNIYKVHKKFQTFTEKGVELLEKEEVFLKKVRSLTVKDILYPIRNVAQDRLGISKGMWVDLFVGSWNLITQQQKIDLHKPILVLLARDYHSSQYVKYPNVIQALLEGISRIDMTISPDQLRFLGKSFNCWNIVLPMIEKKLLWLLKNSSDIEMIERFTTSLTELYKTLDEQDVLHGIWRKFGVQEETNHLFTLERYCAWEDCQLFLNRLFKMFHEGHINRNNVYHPEISLWEEVWLKSTKKLQQWTELHEFAKSSKIPMLALECLWNDGNWDGLGEILMSSHNPKSQKFQIFQISHLIMKNSIPEAIDAFNLSAQGALQRWCALPNFHCHTHYNMLHQFQQLIELYEATTFIADSQGLNNVQKVNSFFYRWSKRLPNDFDNVSYWNEIESWRYYFLCKMSLCSINHVKQGCVVSSLKSTFRFASVLRRNGLIDSARFVMKRIEKLIPVLSKPQEKLDSHFQRAIQEVKCLQHEGKYKEALDFINASVCFQNLKLNKREMIVQYLKGEVLTSLDQMEEANKNFSLAVKKFPEKFMNSKGATVKLGRVWSSWGKLLDTIFIRSEFTDLSKCEDAILAYTQSVRFKPAYFANLPRALFLLTYDSKEAILSKHFVSAVRDLPSWVFLPWLESILVLMQRKEHANVKVIFEEISEDYPQAIYYLIRAMYLQVKEIQQSKLIIKDSKESYECINKGINDIMGILTRSSLTYVQDIEGFMSEFQKKLKPSLEEEFLRCLEKLLCSACDADVFLKLPEYLKHAVENIFAIFFPEKNPSKETYGDNINEIKKNIQSIKELHSYNWAPKLYGDYSRDIKEQKYLHKFTKELKNDFFQFKTKQLKVFEFIEICRKWIKHFSKVLEKIQTILPLESLSRQLMFFQMKSAEVPGQYLNVSNTKPYLGCHERMVHFLPDIFVLNRNKIRTKRIEVRTVEGESRQFVISSSPFFDFSPCFLQSERRTFSLLRNINHLTRKYLPISKKYLKIQIPIVIPLSKRCKLVVEKEEYMCLEKVYSEFCKSNKMNNDSLFQEFWKELRRRNVKSGVGMYGNMQSGNMGQMGARVLLENRVEAFEAVSSKVPKDFLKNYFMEFCPSWNEFFQIRSEFTNQTGVYGLVRWLLNIEKCAMENFHVGLNNGQLRQFNFKPHFEKKGLIQKTGTPFRLTKNIRSFISEFYMEGALLNSISVMTSALIQEKEKFCNELRLFCRSELVNWNVVDERIMDPTFLKDEKECKIRVEANLNVVLQNLYTGGGDPRQVGQHNNLIQNKSLHMQMKSAKRLINFASDKETLSSMSPTWCPFF